MRGRNAGPRPIAPAEVLCIMASAIEVLSGRLPELCRESIERVVYEVATELVSTVTEPQRLATMLRLRATARLSAAAGHPLPIRSTPLPS